MEVANASLKGHYEHLLLSLKQLIEACGPTSDYVNGMRDATEFAKESTIRLIRDDL
jgi:hypothetical protein